MQKTAYKLMLVCVGLTDKHEVPKTFPKGSVGEVAPPPNFQASFRLPLSDSNSSTISQMPLCSRLSVSVLYSNRLLENIHLKWICSQEFPLLYDFLFSRLNSWLEGRKCVSFSQKLSQGLTLGQHVRNERSMHNKVDSNPVALGLSFPFYR